MSTITSIPSVAQTLFNTFEPAERKYDLRTARGKFYKDIAGHATVKVEVGTADLVTEIQRWVEETETYESTYETNKYNALYVTINADIHDVLANVEAYLREVAPTRVVYGDDSERHTLPNFVRIATEKVYIEDRVGGYYGKDEYHAFNVLSAYISPETDTLVSFYETVERNHEWDSNPFLKKDSWRRDKDGIAQLTRYQNLVENLEKHRKSDAEGKRRGALITACVEAGLENRSYAYDTAVAGCTKFKEGFEWKTEAPTRNPIQEVFDIAIETAVKSIVDYYESVLGKTSWEVQSTAFAIGGERRRYFYDENEYLNARPTFIDETYAYALAVEWYLSRDSWDRTPEGIKGEVLKRFYDVIRGYYRR